MTVKRTNVDLFGELFCVKLLWRRRENGLRIRIVIIIINAQTVNVMRKVSIKKLQRISRDALAFVCVQCRDGVIKVRCGTRIVTYLLFYSAVNLLIGKRIFDPLRWKCWNEKWWGWDGNCRRYNGAQWRNERLSRVNKWHNISFSLLFFNEPKPLLLNSRKLLPFKVLSPILSGPCVLSSISIKTFICIEIKLNFWWRQWLW